MKESEDFKGLQKKLRLELLKHYHQANAGHIGCSLSCIDIIISSLVLNKNESDTFILSKGHAALALYVGLHHLGKISDADMDTYYKDGTRLPAHPAANQFKDIPFALGSLGHGFPIATGIAKSNKLLGNGFYTFVLMSDGETNEGTTWEAMHFACQHQLDNLIVIVDKNGLQGFGYLNDVLGDTADPQKWAQVGFEVYELDGHNVAEMNQTIDVAKASKNGKPKLIVAKTIKGKGVSYMENHLEWHYLPMNDELYSKAITEIENTYA
ncbi:MAG: transketolase [Cytophagales bacterium]|nr:transketolase [Cytophagales bacterium]